MIIIVITICFFALFLQNQIHNLIELSQNDSFGDVDRYVIDFFAVVSLCEFSISPGLYPFVRFAFHWKLFSAVESLRYLPIRLLLCQNFHRGLTTFQL